MLGAVKPCLDCRVDPALPGKSRCRPCHRAHESARRKDPTVTGRRGTDKRWARARRTALIRAAYTCGCEAPAIEVHHINGDATDHRQENLAAMCGDCHRRADRVLRENRRHGAR